jgi:L-lysine exporter family protein LysE/ArgO
MHEAAVSGFLVSLSLIAAIGAQNAFVLRQGIRREHVLAVLATCLVLTWANPHVYLDTVVLLGSISAQYAPQGMAFGIGAALGSLVFFSVLGFGARLLGPVFARPQAWVVLEALVGCTMWAIAAKLVLV